MKMYRWDCPYCGFRAQNENGETVNNAIDDHWANTPCGETMRAAADDIPF